MTNAQCNMSHKQKLLFFCWLSDSAIKNKGLNKTDNISVLIKQSYLYKIKGNRSEEVLNTIRYFSKTMQNFQSRSIFDTVLVIGVKYDSKIN